MSLFFKKVWNCLDYLVCHRKGENPTSKLCSLFPPALKSIFLICKMVKQILLWLPPRCIGKIKQRIMDVSVFFKMIKFYLMICVLSCVYYKMLLDPEVSNTDPALNAIKRQVLWAVLREAGARRGELPGGDGAHPQWLQGLATFWPPKWDLFPQDALCLTEPQVVHLQSFRDRQWLGTGERDVSSR